MLSWFTPKCPVNASEKAWTEVRLLWLVDAFGLDRLLDAQVLTPTPEHFPDAFHGTEADAHRYFLQLCRHMRVEPDRVELQILPDEQLPTAAGLYDTVSESPGGPHPIRVAESQLGDAEVLLAILAHELAHELLLGGGLLTTDVSDHEWVTDLLPAFLGLGLFAANSVIREHYWTTGNWSGWDIRRLGYLPPQIHGYALGLFALMREEPAPPWAGLLRRDARVAFAESVNYVNKTKDSLFLRETVMRESTAWTEEQVLFRLQHGSASVRIAALWKLLEIKTALSSGFGPALMACLKHADPWVASEAARAVPILGTEAHQAVPRLLEDLVSPLSAKRSAAAYALGEVKPTHELVIPLLARALSDDSSEVVYAASNALGRFGHSAGPMLKEVLPAFHRAVAACSYSLMWSLATTLQAIVPDPKRQVREYFGKEDLELRRLALEALNEPVRWETRRKRQDPSRGTQCEPPLGTL
jgi:hypothetical protein